MDPTLGPEDAPLRQAGERLFNPLDARAAQVAHEEKRQYHLNRMRFAGIGMALSFMALVLSIYNIDLDDMEKAEKERRSNKLHLDASSEANKEFQGKEVHIIGTGEDKRITAQGPSGVDIELVETGTSSVPHFPKTIYLPSSPSSSASTDAPNTIGTAAPNARENPGNSSNQEEYTLLGLGIRTVSFLSIQVYVVGMYIRTQDISALQEKLIHTINPQASTLIPSEKAELESRLSDPETSRELWTELLAVPGLKTAWRIAPTRNTDFAHLRDGWITGINKRITEARQAAGADTELDGDAFGESMRHFKSVFAGGKAPKGSVMVLARDRMGMLDVLFQEKPETLGGEKKMQVLGRVEDERVARLIWLGYLGGKNVSSEAARKGVVEGAVKFASRPVGSVETMVT